LTRHLYEYDEVVIGSGLEAAAYSYIRNVPLILNAHQSPYRFDFLDPDISLEKIDLKNTKSALNTPSGSLHVGMSKLDVWQHTLFLLSLSGLCSLSEKTETVRIEDRTVKVTTKGSKLTRFNFTDKLTIFNEANVYGLPEPVEKVEPKFRVIDWIDVKSGSSHEFDRIEVPSYFANCIHFYPSERSFGKQVRKDAAVVSFLDSNQLLDYRYSDVYVRFMTKKIMKDFGIKGRKNGRDPKDPKKNKHLGIKLDSAYRQREQINKNKYEDTELFIFNRRSIKEILEQTEPLKQGSYMSKLNEMIHGEW
jgi:hypothetical protein